MLVFVQIFMTLTCFPGISDLTFVGGSSVSVPFESQLVNLEYYLSD